MNPSAALRILLSRDAIAKWAARIAGVLDGRPHQLLPADAPEAVGADIAFITRDVTGLSTKHRILPATQQVYDHLRAASGLRWLHIHSAGADRPIYVDLHRRGVAVTTSAGANGSVVAQTALLGLLALARGWPTLMAAQRERRWAPLLASGLPRDLQGQTVVLVGWGAVGRALGGWLRALGLQLIVVRRQPAPAEPGLRFVQDGQLDQVLPQADWLVLACALNDATRGLVSRERLALLPAHCGLVNVARGEVIDQPALVEALQARRLGGACLDVFAEEPLAPASPLWDLPNVIVTPHSAGFSDGHEARVADLFLQNLGRWVRSEPLLQQLAGS